jgi:hypothetical protein
MRWLILLFALPLAGCWEGDIFYATSDSRPALPPGTYHVVPTDDPADAGTAQVSILDNGMTQIRDDKGINAVGFAPLGSSSFVAWIPEQEEGWALYALFQKERGRYRFVIPFCDKTKVIAAAAGAQIAPDPKVAICRFRTRAQLEDGLRHLEGRKVDSIEFVLTAANPRGGPSPAP